MKEIREFSEYNHDSFGSRLVVKSTGGIEYNKRNVLLGKEVKIWTMLK